jgi:hypothetical protein
MVYDMTGNVWEWVNETVSTTAPPPGTAGHYFPSDAGWITTQTDTKYGYDGVYFYAGTQTGRAVVRGGDWGNGALAGPFNAHLPFVPSSSGSSLGFRCCSGSNLGSGISAISSVSDAYAGFSSMTTGITLGSYENVTQGINTNVANISNTSLAACQNWTLQCSAYNSNGASTALNSSIMTISPCGDTKTWIWDGSEWVAYTNQLNYRCSNPFPSYCQPVNQNNATSQPIFRDQNNGSGSSAWQAISTNATWATASLICGTSTNPSLNTNVSPANTSKNYSTSALAAGENNSIYCHFYIVSVPSGFERDFSINFTKG